MTSYIVRRFLEIIPTLVLASMAVFLFVHLLPGDVIFAILGENPNPEAIAYERERLGLDRPLPVQYLTWTGNILQGDLGTSHYSGQPVASLIASRLMPTVQLILVSFALAIVFAMPLALLGALTPKSIWGRLANAQSFLGLSIPTFWLGILLILVFGVQLQVLPSASDYLPLWHSPGEALRHLLLPGVTLAIFISAIFARFLRQALTETLEKDYVRTARAKGVREGLVVARHALRNALLPFVTIAGLQLGTFVGGAVVTESVFNYPGLGRFAFTAISQRDIPSIQGVTLVIVGMVTVINLVVDLLYAYLDPRISY